MSPTRATIGTGERLSHEIAQDADGQKHEEGDDDEVAAQGQNGSKGFVFTLDRRDRPAQVTEGEGTRSHQARPVSIDGLADRASPRSAVSMTAERHLSLQDVGLARGVKRELDRIRPSPPTMMASPMEPSPWAAVITALMRSTGICKAKTPMVFPAASTMGVEMNAAGASSEGA